MPARPTQRRSNGITLICLCLIIVLICGATENAAAQSYSPPASAGIKPAVTVGCAGGRSAVDFIAGCASGSADETVINAAIASLPAGGTVQLLEGTYHLKPLQTGISAIILHSGVTLAGAGQGATVLTMDPNSNAPTCAAGISVQTANIINIAGMNNVRVRDLTLNGGIGTNAAAPLQCPGPDDNVGNGLRIDNSNQIFTDHIGITQAYTHGYFLNCVSGDCQDIRITHFDVWANGQIGLHVHVDDAGTHAIKDYLITDGEVWSNSVINSISYTGGTYQYGEVWTAFLGDSYGIMANLFIHDTRGPAVTIVGSHSGDPASTTPKNIVFQNIHTRNCGLDNTNGYNSCVLFNPTFYDSAGTFSRIEVDGVTADGATGPCFLISAGISPYSVAGLTIRGGAARNCTYGVYSSNNVIHGLTILDMDIVATTQGGMLFQTTNGIGTSGIGNQHLLISRNTIRNTGGVGITINGTNTSFPWRDVVVSDNTVINNASACMALNNITNFAVTANMCDDNVGQDIFVQGTSAHGSIGPDNIVGVTATTSSASRIQIASGGNDVDVIGNICTDAGAICVYHQGTASRVALNHGSAAGITLGATSTAIATFGNSMTITNSGTGTGANANTPGTISP